MAEKPSSSPGDMNEAPEVVERPDEGLFHNMLENLKEDVDSNKKTIKVDYDLSENYEPGRDETLELDGTQITKLEASVDATVHKKIPTDIASYVSAAKKVEAYAQYFDKETKAWFEKNEPIINEIKNLPDDISDEDWTKQIAEKHKRDLTKSSGALNFLLAAMRATDICPFEQLNNPEKIAPGFEISLKSGGSWDEASERYAKLEMTYPKEVSYINSLIKDAASFIGKLKENYSTEETLNDKLKDDFKKLLPLFKALLGLKEEKPATFDHFNYDQYFNIIGKSMYNFYSSISAPDIGLNILEQLGQFFSTDNLSDQPKETISQDPMSLDYINNQAFWEKYKNQNGMIDINSTELVDQMTDYLAKQKELQSNPDEIEVYLSLSNRLMEYYQYKLKPIDLAITKVSVRQALRDVDNAKIVELKEKYGHIIEKVENLGE